MIDYKTKKEISYDEYVKKITDGLKDNEEAIILLSEIFDLNLLNKDLEGNIEDHSKISEETIERIAMTFNIPVDMFKGTKTDKSTSNNDFITYACNPIMRTIEDTLNINLVKEDDYIKGSKIQFNRFCMQHIDITSLGTSLDKLTSIGFSFNQICDLLGLPTVEEDWANEHHITKNYATTEDSNRKEGK